MVKYISQNTARTFRLREGKTMSKLYTTSARLNPGSHELRNFLRSYGFTVYRRNITDTDCHQDDGSPDDNTHYYECIRNSKQPLPQAVYKRLDEEFQKGLVINYNNTAFQ